MPIEYDVLHDSLVLAGVVIALPELHGGICGALCAGGADAALRWLHEAFDNDEDAESLAPVRDALHELVETSVRMLDGDALEFEPLLPDDDAPLDEQVQALAAWCQGFLAALGEHAPDVVGPSAAGKARRPQQSGSQAQSSAELHSGSVEADIPEILADFAEISRAGLTDDEATDPDQADFALAELKEYARMSTQIVFEELRPRRDMQSQSRDLH